MIWIAIAIIIVGILIANAIRPRPQPQIPITPNPGAPKHKTKAERIKSISAGIDELRENIKKRDKDNLEKLEIEAQKQTNKGVKEYEQENIKLFRKYFYESEKFVKLNAQLAEALRYQEDELLKQQTDWFNLLEFYEYTQIMNESSFSYYELGLEPPEVSSVERAKATEIRKRINARLREHGLLPKNSPDPLEFN